MLFYLKRENKPSEVVPIMPDVREAETGGESLKSRSSRPGWVAPQYPISPKKEHKIWPESTSRFFGEGLEQGMQFL